MPQLVLSPLTSVPLLQVQNEAFLTETLVSWCKVLGLHLDMINTPSKVTLMQHKPHTIFFGIVNDLADAHRAAFLGNNRVIVPVDKVNTEFAYAGMIYPPRTLIEVEIKQFLGDGDSSVLAGLSLREARDVIFLARSLSYEDATAALVVARSNLVRVAGLSVIPPSSEYYYPDSKLVGYIKLMKPFIENPLLKPKGILLYGSPGTGKTKAASFLAKNFDLPLFRLDLSMLLDKWLGMSESSLLTLLRAVENTKCVLLIDEVEKLFRSDAFSSDTLYRLLSMFLWWLQERTGDLIVVMTTNAKDAIPPELLRYGRLDMHLELEGLGSDHILAFVRELLEFVGMKDKHDLAESICKGVTVPIGQAQLVEFTKQKIRSALCQV